MTFSLRSLKFAVLASVLSLSLNNVAQADTMSFIAHWSGDAFGNGETAQARVSLDTSNGVLSYVDLTTSVGGHYITSDFSKNTYWNIDPSMNLHTELVGQNYFGHVWGTPDGVSGDFNLFPPEGAAFGLISNNANVMQGTYYFTLTDDSTQLQLLLTSFVEENNVPEPSSIALLGLGAAGLLAARRRK